MADKLHPYPDILTQAYHSAYSDQLPPYDEFANSLLAVEDPEVIEDMANYLYKDKFEHLDRKEFDEKTGLNLYREHQEGPGFLKSFTDSFSYSLIQANPMMYGETAEAVGVLTDRPQLEKMGEDLQDWAEGLDIGEAPTAEMQDIDSVKSFFQWIAQAAGSGIGSTVIPMATGAVGAVAGTAVGGPVGGSVGAILGAMVGAAPLNMGEIYAQLKQEGVPKENASIAALIANIPVTALDAIGVERLLKVFPGSASVKKALGQRLGQAVAGMARGAAAEGVTETGQSAIREAVAAWMTENPNVQERLLSILNEGAAGAVTGGAIGGVRSAAGRVSEPAPETTEAARAVPQENQVATPDPAQPTLIPETERSLASLVMEEEAKAGKRTKIDPLQVKVGDRVVVDRPTGQPEEGTVSEASENLVRVKNDAGSPIGYYVPGVQTDLSLYEVLPDEEAIADRAKQDADLAEWNAQFERAIGRVKENPDATVSSDALTKLRNAKRDFLSQIRQQREEVKEAASDAVAEPVPDTVSTSVPDRAGVVGAGTAGDAVTDAADRVAALEGEDVETAAVQERDIPTVEEDEISRTARPTTQETETVDEATERAPIDFKPVKTDTVVTSSGQDHQVEYAVVDAAALVVSHDQEGNVNPAYPQQIQPRERGRKASQLQIQRIATGIQPRLLGESPTAESGAPIVDPEGIVESGNARAIALQRAYASGQADEYRAFLEDQGYATEGIEQPVLVRIRRSELSEAERQAFAREASQPATLGVSRTEQAFMDADAMPEGVVGQHKGGDLALARNLPFVQSYIQNVIPKDQQTEFAAKGGELSVEGRQRMEAALIAKAFGNRDLVSRLTESVEQGRESVEQGRATIKNAVLDLAPRWAAMREAVSKEELYPVVDQTQALVDAVGIVARNEQTGTAVSELLEPGLFPGDQPELVGERGQMMRSILSLFYRDSGKWRGLRAAKDITEALDQYLVNAQRRDPRTADMFEGEKAPEPLALTQRAKETQDGGAQEPGGDGTDTDTTKTGTAGERSRREGVVDEGRTEPPIAAPPQRDDGQDPATFQPLVDELETLIARLAPGVALETPSRARDAQGRFISGKFTPGMRQQIITVASTGNPAATLRHEVIHALRNAGLFSDSEWKALRRDAVSKGWLTKYRVKERYPELYDVTTCLLYTSPSPRDRTRSRMPSSA